MYSKQSNEKNTQLASHFQILKYLFQTEKFNKQYSQSIKFVQKYFILGITFSINQTEGSIQGINDNIYEQDDNDLQEYYSSLRCYYENLPQSENVYQKTKNVGTSWIKKKQYFTSLFVNTELIQKSSRPLFGTNNQKQKDEQISVIDNVNCTFDSDFQSGNLFAAYKVGILEYDLLLQNDINTKGNTQWFYFRIKNPPPNKNIKINIVNFRKPDSLFNYGMLPAFYSAQSNKKNQEGWIRKGSKVKYFKNTLQIQNSRKYYYTLTFTISTPYVNDVLEIAHCYPYTYTDLQNYLSGIEKTNYKKQLCVQQSICKTLGKNKIQVLTIRQQNAKTKALLTRPLIIILSRQHPGQTPGSFIAEGIMDYFMSKQKDAEYLRKTYEIKILPMINPDGVIVGNYRTNLFGYDLNRKWDSSSKENSKNDQHQVTHIKRYLSQLVKGRQIAFIIDFHGHSRKLYSFFYGNTCSLNPCDVRIYPYICSKLSPMVKFQDSTFTVQQQKRTTARIQMFLNYKIPNIFTFEASFFGYINKNKQKRHFTIENYKNLGMIIGKSIYFHQKSKEQGINSKEKILIEKWTKQLVSNNYLMKLGQNVDSGSQSCPDQFQILQAQRDLLEQQQAYQTVKKLTKTTSKLTKKKLKQQILGKQIQKNLRQMQVMDIARVNSVFPHANDILALVPTTFYLKQKVKQKKHAGIQTDPCPLLKIYEKNDDFNFNQSQFKSMIFTRNKTKSISQIYPSNISLNEKGSLFQQSLKTLSKFPQKFRSTTYEQSRNLNQYKKLQMRSNKLKKFSTEHQLSKPKKMLKIIKSTKITQTEISFIKQQIIIIDEINDPKIPSDTPDRFWTIEPRRKSISFETNRFQSIQFRRTGMKTNQLDNWRIKKKSLI